MGPAITCPTANCSTRSRGRDGRGISNRSEHKDLQPPPLWKAPSRTARQRGTKVPGADNRV